MLESVVPEPEIVTGVPPPYGITETVALAGILIVPPLMTAELVFPVRSSVDWSDKTVVPSPETVEFRILVPAKLTVPAPDTRIESFSANVEPEILHIDLFVEPLTPISRAFPVLNALKQITNPTTVVIRAIASTANFPSVFIFIAFTAV